MLTNTLSVATGVDALISYTLDQEENAGVRSVNAVVGETNDGYLNDIRSRRITREQVLQAIGVAEDGPVKEGEVIDFMRGKPSWNSTPLADNLKMPMVLA